MMLKNAMVMAGLVTAGIVLGADAPKANVQRTMLTKVNPQALALWDITNNSQDAAGNFDRSKVTTATWTNMVDIGKALEEGGRTLASRNRIIAAAPGAKLQDEGGPGASKAADVQRYVDAKPKLFRSHALELQKTGAAVVEAATTHDATQLNALVNSLDGVCENCHVIFWYPQQKK